MWKRAGVCASATIPHTPAHAGRFTAEQNQRWHNDQSLWGTRRMGEDLKWVTEMWAGLKANKRRKRKFAVLRRRGRKRWLKHSLSFWRSFLLFLCGNYLLLTNQGGPATHQIICDSDWVPDSHTNAHMGRQPAKAQTLITFLIRSFIMSQRGQTWRPTHVYVSSTKVKSRRVDVSLVYKYFFRYQSIERK